MANKGETMNHQHSSSIYQVELENLRTAILKMGGKVENQLNQAVQAYNDHDGALAEKVMSTEREVNQEHLDIDQMSSEIIALRQPAASDLRMLLGSIRIISDLERIGDEAAKIAKMALKDDKRGTLSHIQTIFQSAELAVSMLRRTLDAFAREDTSDMPSVFASDLELDSHYQASMRQLITFMMEDPRTISAALDDLWVAKSIERVGDHAENIAETVIYIFEGEDVRYTHHP
jgi:phosphate transport system protein